MKKHLFILHIFLLFPLINFAQEKIENKNYEDLFNIHLVVDYRASFDQYKSKFIICNDILEYKNIVNKEKFQSNILFYINETKNDTNHILNIDTLKYSLSDIQIETIYSLTKNIIMLPQKVEKSKTTLNFTPPYDGSHTKIMLEINSGIIYNVEFEQADNNLELKKLIDYLLNIVNR